MLHTWELGGSRKDRGGEEWRNRDKREVRTVGKVTVKQFRQLLPGGMLVLNCLVTYGFEKLTLFKVLCKVEDQPCKTGY